MTLTNIKTYNFWHYELVQMTFDTNHFKWQQYGIHEYCSCGVSVKFKFFMSFILLEYDCN